MSWHAIGESIIGTAHIQGAKGCEDAIAYERISGEAGETLICCVSDGAGSARFAGEASRYVTTQGIASMVKWVGYDQPVTEFDILVMAEGIYDGLVEKAAAEQCELNEFSCTFLGVFLNAERSVFFQIGDGAIVRNDGDGLFTPVWWPHNGEYSNTTSFLVDDASFSNLKKLIIDEPICEVALFTDGLQHLVLNNETSSVHQPFFEDLFKWLRRTSNEQEVQILKKKLAAYLAGEAINTRTNDDKTLFLATRMIHER